MGRDLIINQHIKVNDIIGQTDACEYLRTPDINMLEILFSEQINYKREELLFEVSILVNGKAVDSFKGQAMALKIAVTVHLFIMGTRD